jgi:hypothetical protein
MTAAEVRRTLLLAAVAGVVVTAILLVGLPEMVLYPDHRPTTPTGTMPRSLP